MRQPLHNLQYRYLEMMTREREQKIMAAAQKQALAQLGPEQIHQLNSLPEVDSLTLKQALGCLPKEFC